MLHNYIRHLYITDLIDNTLDQLCMFILCNGNARFQKEWNVSQGHQLYCIIKARPNIKALSVIVG